MKQSVAHDTWRALTDTSRGEIGRFDPSTVAGLPEPARRFLTTTIRPGAPLDTAVELSMVGRIKLGVWLPFTARQLLCAGVGLVWAADVGPRILRFIGADTLGPDGAHMQFKLYGRLPIVDERGPDTDLSAAGRLAAETVAWLPQALTPQAGAAWASRDTNLSTVTLPGPSGPIDVDVTIDDAGRLVSIGLDRWNDAATPPRVEPFGGTITSTCELGGVRLAESGTVGWGHGTPAQDESVFFTYRIAGARFVRHRGALP